MERYHHSKSALSNATLRLHHTVSTAALRIAKRDKLVRDNAALEATERPKKHEERSLNSWDTEEARKVLVAAKSCSTQTGTFFALALDSGARKAELQGLRWTDINLTTGASRIERQLLKYVPTPEFGPTKTREPRTLDLSEHTVTLLREHKREQSALKLANRPQYQDNGLVFAQAWVHRGTLGAPLRGGVITRMLESLIRTSSVRRITVHGLGHTSATLMLAAGVQPHVVQKRLGHSNIRMTLGIYGHVMPAQQQDAAKRLGTLLHG